MVLLKYELYMRRSLKLFSLTVFVIYLSLFDSHRLVAQPLLNGGNHDKIISLEILKAKRDQHDNTKFTTFVLYLTGRFALSRNLTLIGELPFSHDAHKRVFVDAQNNGHYEDPPSRENAIGNPYLGIEFRRENSLVFGEIGFRPPFAPDDEHVSFSGFWTDFVDRADAFVKEATTVSGALNYMINTPTGFVLRIRGGTTLWMAPDEPDEESEWFLNYSAQVGYELPQISLVVGFSSRIWMGEDPELGKSFHQIGIATNMNLGVAQPGISLRVPIGKEMTEILDYLYSLNLSLNLK